MIVGDAVGNSDWAKFGRDVVSGLTTVGVRTALGGKFETSQVFGNALGNAVVDQAARPW